MRLQIDIYEDANPNPVLSHVFYGKTATEINKIVQAHMQYDQFFNAAMTTGTFKGMRLTVNNQWLP